jgi:hypothetical protein
MENDNSKITERAAIFDQCVAAMPADKQREYKELVIWVSNNILTQGGGLMSAKELIVQLVRWGGSAEIG